MVPRKLQNQVFATYQRGQEEGKVTPTQAWHDAADAAIEAVYEKEHHQKASQDDLPLGQSGLQAPQEGLEGGANSSQAGQASPERT